MAYREPFYEYAIRNSIWMTLLIIIESWIWYWFINGFDLVQIGIFFISLEGYLTILIILGINVVSAFTASYLRIKYKQSLTKHKEIIL
jgi:apolipoprotein N-acyltransferase